MFVHLFDDEKERNLQQNHNSIGKILFFFLLRKSFFSLFPILINSMLTSVPVMVSLNQNAIAIQNCFQWRMLQDFIIPSSTNFLSIRVYVYCICSCTMLFSQADNFCTASKKKHAHHRNMKEFIENDKVFANEIFLLPFASQTNWNRTVPIPTRELKSSYTNIKCSKTKLWKKYKLI